MSTLHRISSGLAANSNASDIDNANARISSDVADDSNEHESLISSADSMYEEALDGSEKYEILDSEGKALTSHSAHTPLTLRSHSAHTPLTLRSHSAHTPLTLRSHSAHTPLTPTAFEVRTTHKTKNLNR